MLLEKAHEIGGVARYSAGRTLFGAGRLGGDVARQRAVVYTLPWMP